MRSRAAAYGIPGRGRDGTHVSPGDGHWEIPARSGPIGPDGQQPGERPIAGTVLFRAGPGQAVKVRVGKSGTFSVRLPAGTYRVSGRSPAVMQVSNGAVIGAGGKLISGREHERPCTQQQTVTVASGQTARIAVTCIVP